MCIRNLRQGGNKAGIYQILVDEVDVEDDHDESEKEHVVATCGQLSIRQ